ncbi:MAG: hypothetical protein Q8P12_04350 [bacterium]|nr:hypothetical protein [bacterium]
MLSHGQLQHFYACVQRLKLLIGHPSGGILQFLVKLLEGFQGLLRR